MTRYAVIRRVLSSTSNLLSSKLTSEEMHSLQLLPFIRDLENSSSSETQGDRTTKSDAQRLVNRIPKKKREYTDNKLLSLKPWFQDPSSKNMLNYQITNPDLQNIKPYDMIENKRLSVTKLLTKQWCELRKMYDIYAKAQIFKTSRVSQGSDIHLSLENETHKEVHNFLEVYEIYNLTKVLEEFNDIWNEENKNGKVKIDLEAQEMEIFEEDIFAVDWCNNVSKLCDLFANGEARELLVHGYVNKLTGEFVCDDASVFETPRDDLILVSGIIDHVFVPEHLKTVLSESLEQPKISPSSIMDIDALLQEEKLGKPWVYHLGDVKTRAYNSIPSQPAVIESSKLQVMYYKFLLEGLSKHDTQHIFDKLMLNSQIRKLDAKKCLQPEQIFYLYVQFEFFQTDLINMKNGRISPECSQMLSQEENSTPKYEQDKLNYYLGYYFPDQNFTGEWRYWPTLEYIAIRMSQLYSHLLKNPKSSISKDLTIEYYNKRNDLFQTVDFQYNNEFFMENCKSSLDFWLGKRKVQPVDPSIDDNLHTYCKHCEYNSSCLWKAEHLQNEESNENESRKIGDMLQKIHDDLQ